MTGDGLALLQLADRIGLNLFALLTIGFALHAASGVVERDSFRGLRPRIALTGACCGCSSRCSASWHPRRADGGWEEISSIPELMPLAWLVLGDSTLAILVGAVASIAGMWFGSRVTRRSRRSSAQCWLRPHGPRAGADRSRPCAHNGRRACLDRGLLGRCSDQSLIQVPTLRQCSELTFSRLRPFQHNRRRGHSRVLIALGASGLRGFVTEGGRRNCSSQPMGFCLLAKLAIGVIAMRRWRAQQAGHHSEGCS